MTAAMSVLVRKVEAQRLQQMKMLARSGYRHIKKPALLVDLFGFAACHIRRNTAVDEVENEDRVPFLPLGRMNGRQDQIVLVELRAAGFGAAGSVPRAKAALGLALAKSPTVIDGIRPRKSRSHQTPRWSERDSNLYGDFPVK